MNKYQQSVVICSRQYELSPPYVIPVRTADGRPVGEKFVPRTDARGYPYISFRRRGLGIDKKVYVHKIAAYQNFGEEAFDNKKLCRHLDGDKANFSRRNIALGSYRDNHFDMSPEKRAHIAKSVGAKRRSLSDSDVIEAKRLRESGKTFSFIASQLSVSINTIRCALNGTFYKEFHGSMGERLIPSLC